LERVSSAFFSLNLSNEVRLVAVVLTLVFTHFCFSFNCVCVNKSCLISMRNVNGG
jgi:hypothetical protein